MSEHKIYELESIRGIAAVLVVIFHIPCWNSYFYDFDIIRNGYLMVQLFFVLSGFVIYSAYIDKLKSGQQLIRFQFLRFGRLYPVHLLFLMIFILIECSKYYAQHKLGMASPGAAAFTTNNATAVLQQLVLFQAIGPYAHDMTFNYPAWSISVEFYTYLIFAVTVLFARQFKHFLFLFFALASLFFLISNFTFGFLLVFQCTAGFFIGCLTAMVSRQVKTPVRASLSLWIIGLIVAFLYLKNPLYTGSDPIIYFLTAALILSVVLCPKGIVKSVLNWKILTWLGTISYSLYMSHVAIIWMMNQVFRVVLKRPERMVEGFSTPQLGFVEAVIFYTLFIAIVLMVSQLTYRFIEKPFREKSRRVDTSKFFNSIKSKGSIPLSLE